MDLASTLSPATLPATTSMAVATAAPIPVPVASAPTRLSPTRCLAVLTGLSAVSLIGTLAFPALQDHPLALVLMSPRLPFVLLAGASVSPLLLIPIVALRLCAGDVFHFHLGRGGASTPFARRIGSHRWMQHRWIASARARLARRRRATDHAVVLAILLRPIGRHLVLAGATGACPRRVAAADAIGTVAYVVAVVATAGLLL